MVVMEYLILVAENVIVYVEVLGGLLDEDERLHELAHRFPVVRQLTRYLKSQSRLGDQKPVISIKFLEHKQPTHLDEHSIANSLLAVHLPDLRMAVPEVKGKNLLVDDL